MEFIEKKVRELYTSSSGLSKPADQFGFGYPFLSYTDIFHNYYVPEELKTMVNSNEMDRKRCSIERGDIFLTRTSETTDELGMSCVALRTINDATFNGFAKRLRPLTDEIVPEYAAYYCRSSYFRGQCMSMASLITRASLNDGMISRLRIRYPKDKHDQELIGNMLMNYDKCIANNKKRIKILEQIAENLYKEWFVRFRFPGHEKAEFENGIPKGWDFKRISEVGTIVSGGTPSTLIEDYWDGDIPWLTPADLSDFYGIYISNGETFITELGLNKSSARIMPGNTVLLSSRAPIGYVALARNEICTNQGFKSVICDEKIINHFYLFYFFKMNKPTLECFGTGSTFPELSAKRLKRIKFIVPPLDIQDKFALVVGQVADEVYLLQEKNRNLMKQRDLLLPRLMSGKLEIK